jgi:hypothetical protein
MSKSEIQGIIEEKYENMHSNGNSATVALGIEALVLQNELILRNLKEIK